MIFTEILFSFDCHSVSAVLRLASWPLLSVFNRAFKMYEFVVYSTVSFMLGNSYPQSRRWNISILPYVITWKEKGKIICSKCLFTSLNYLPVIGNRLLFVCFISWK